MKKAFAVVLLAVFLLTVSACGHTDVPAQTTAPATQAPEATTAPTEEAVRIGKSEGNTYQNEFLGLGITLENDWTAATKEELAALNNMAADSMSDAALAETLRNSGVVSDFFAVSTNGDTISLVLEDLKLLYSILLDEDGYAQAAAEQVPTALTSAGLTDVTAQVTSVTFAGAQHAAITVHGLVGDVDFYETMVCIKVDNTIGVITAASYYQDTTADILNLFYALEN